MLFVDVAITKKVTSHTKGIFGNTKKTITDNMCMKVLEHVGIKDIYYSNEQGETVKVRI